MSNIGGFLALNDDNPPAAQDLVRLAFPRRVYTQSHVDYIAETEINLHGQRNLLTGYRIVEQTPVLQHPTAKLEPIQTA